LEYIEQPGSQRLIQHAPNLRPAQFVATVLSPSKNICGGPGEAMINDWCSVRLGVRWWSLNGSDRALVTKKEAKWTLQFTPKTRLLYARSGSSITVQEEAKFTAFLLS